jgi:uncharacterized protein (DUF362 family)
MDRREFLKGTAGLSGAAIASPFFNSALGSLLPSPNAQVAFVKTTNRAEGVAHAIDLLGLKPFRGRDLFIKPNFNSSDTPPGSTHEQTLVSLLRKLKALNAGPMTIGDRSGMGNTRQVMQTRNAFSIAMELDAKTVVFDELRSDDWDLVRHDDQHWRQGFALPRLVRNAGGIVQTCNLKTHRFGGHFTLSLKNSVGLAAKYVPGNSYNFMRELHSSPDQRRMIAEINAAYRPELVVLDGVEAFVNGGPEAGKKVTASVVLAGTDRVAIDAVGVAILRYYGTTPEVSRGGIFEQEQIARAVQLGIGVSSPKQIEIVTDDRESAEYAKSIRAILDGSPS